jgi:DNA-binding transcriptional MerR regulator
MRLDVGDEEERGSRGPVVTKIVGITYRQLDYWARTGLAVPSVREAKGSGTQRLYSFADVVELRVIKRLLDAGVTLQRVREVVDELRRRGRSLADVTLVADEASVYAVEDDAQVVDVLRRGQGVFAIALGPIVDELRGEVTAFPSEPLTVETDEAATEAAETGS